MMVEAAAGTGKTLSLVSRMVALISSGRCSVDTLAAITFTIKAAAQLRERFQEEIEKAIAASGPGVKRERLQDARDNLARCFIGTTHAFCGRLLHERPVEADLDPEFAEVDQVAAELLANDFWTGFVDRLVTRGDPRLQELRDAGVPIRFLRTGFTRLVEYPDVDIFFEAKSKPDLTAVFDELVTRVQKIEPDLPSDADGHEPDPFEKMIRQLLHKIGTMDTRDVAEQFDLLVEANHASRKAVQKRWADGKVAKKHSEDYAAFVLKRLRPLVASWLEYAHGVALGLLVPAVKEFEDERCRAGRLTFQDLLMRARDLLRDHAHVRRYFQRRFTHLLVDEFQDTDPVQAEVMFYLTGVEVAEKNWRKLRPIPGSLFIVGDPKQSIYRFRRADITTYLQVKNRILESGGVIHQLTSNFRSSPVICSFVNESLGGSFAGEAVEKGRQAPYVALAPTRGDGIFSGVYSLITTGEKNPEIAAAEASCLANWIRRAVENGTEIDDDGQTRPIAWSDFLLISHSRPRLAIYAEALELEGVPSEVTGSRAFAKAEELRMLMPLLRVVLDAEDQVSLVAYLRGPLCGVDDQALYDFVQAGGRFSFHSELPETTAPRLRDGMNLAREAWREARELPPAATIARLVDRLGLLAQAAAKDRGVTRSGNLLKALAIARQESAGGASLALIVDRFEALLEGESDIQEMGVNPAAANAVRLMNLHQVKGLEAPVVFLIDPGSPRSPDVDIHVDRSEDTSRAYLTLWRPFGQGKKLLAAPVGWSNFEATEKEFALAEEQRLLYVAATRAKNILVAGAKPSKRGLEGYWRHLAQQAGTPLPDLPQREFPKVPIRSRNKDSFQEARGEIATRFEARR